MKSAVFAIAAFLSLPAAQAQSRWVPYEVTISNYQNPAVRSSAQQECAITLVNNTSYALKATSQYTTSRDNVLHVEVLLDESRLEEIKAHAGSFGSGCGFNFWKK